MKGMVKRKNNLGIPPSQESECLLVFEEIFQADLVVHDGLQAFDAPDLDKKVNQHSTVFRIVILGSYSC